MPEKGVVAMVFHPRDRWPWNRAMTRRDMLRLSAGTAGGAFLLAACGPDRTESGGQAAGVTIGSPNNPVQQPLYDDNPAIESDLEPEEGPLMVYNWDAYIWQRVLKDFETETGVPVKLTTFYNLEEATRKLSTGRLKFDVFFPTAEVIPKFVAAKLFQPLNLDYVPNLQKNIWPRLTDPYYDQGSRYTVPYVVYHTGIGWRADLIPDDIASLDNPWEALWNPAYKGKVGMYDDYRETIGAGMYYNGITDINSAKPEALDPATESLSELADLVDVRYTIDGAYSGIPEKKFGIHNAWSGDMIGAQYYFPKGAGDASVLRYIWPPKGNFNGGYVSNDSMAIPSNAEHPVLAHMFLDFMLSEKYAMKNFGWLGYQPPLTSLDPKVLVDDGWVPSSVESAIVTEDDFGLGQAPIQLTTEEDAAWLAAWTRIKAGG
jgi:spermidine/putrescine transport system substrate-binding protein